MAFERASFVSHSASFALQPSEKSLPVGFVRRGIGRIDPRQRFKDVGGDGLGVLGIEPIVRVAAAMGMAVAGADAHPAQLQHGNGERGVDIAGAAAADLGLAGLCKQAIDPQIVVEPHAHEQARIA